MGSICALIMAGGRGTRFWPLSTELLPKQFLALAHPSRSLLQQTFDRVAPLVGPERVLVLTSARFAHIVYTQLPDVPRQNVVLEAVPKDTAAAVALGSALAAFNWPEATQVFLPADHYIAPDESFRQTLEKAALWAAEDGRIHTLGIQPTAPSTAYGYIEVGDALHEQGEIQGYVCKAFREKPDIDTARHFLASGDYLWNAGIFIFRPGAIAQALGRWLPKHRAISEMVVSKGPAYLDTAQFRRDFAMLDKISIDYGVMQQEGARDGLRVATGPFAWSDIGGWPAFAALVDDVGDGNRVYGRSHFWKDEGWQQKCYPRETDPRDPDEDLHYGDVFLMGSSGNLVVNAQRGHGISLLGVKEHAVIHTRRHTLVVPLELANSLKKLVENLPDGTVHEGGPCETRKVEKPWGYEIWWAWTDHFAGKLLFVRKGKRFSLQYHAVKEEVISVYRGRVRVQFGRHGTDADLREEVLRAGDALHVTPGILHRFEAVEDAYLLEASTPDLWDVVRVSDDFGREGTRKAVVATNED